jgi:hypothetical protein
MQAHGHWTSGGGPGASANGDTVSIYVDHNHPLLRLQRAWPWAALCEVMGRQWRRAGKNPEGRPGLPWDMALYVPLVVVMLVKQLNARAMEASLAAHVVARVCIGRQDDPWPQMRDQANLARAYAALGTEGVDEITAVILPGATDLGCAEPSRLSSDTTAQAWPMGSPNEPGMVRGWAQRWGRALQKRTTRAVGGGATWRWLRSRRSSDRSKPPTSLPRAHQRSVRGGPGSSPRWGSGS